MKRWIINTIAYALIALWTLWPVVSVCLAFFMAWLGNATVDEGSMHPCIIAGHDYGETVYTLFVLGWFGMWTIPTGVLAFIFYTGGAVIEWLISKAVKRRRARLAENPPQ
ncbi:MAG: hypothetical protein ABI615_03845 [Chthoniobacterales bacterium]